VILAANHMSYMDPPLIGSLIWRPVRFMAKDELFRIPILRQIVRGLGAFPVKRSMADRVALRHALELLEAGEVVGIFPEGTRSDDGRLQDLEPGIAFIALKSMAPIVPVGIQGTEKMLPPHAKFPRPARLLVRAGAPITFPDLYGQRNTPEVREEVIQRIKKGIAGMLDEQYLPDPRSSAT